eukprot:gene39554-49185_t
MVDQPQRTENVFDAAARDRAAPRLRALLRAGADVRATNDIGDGCYEDPSTGECEATLCYDVDLSNGWAGCGGRAAYEADGFTCVDSGRCARDGATTKCQTCAQKHVGKVADPDTGRCVSPWSLDSAALVAHGKLMGMYVGTVKANIPWDQGKLEVNITQLKITDDIKIESGLLTVQKVAPQVEVIGQLAVLGGLFDARVAVSNVPEES